MVSERRIPEGGVEDSDYEAWLRKLVLQALGRESAQDPVIFVDPAAAWAEPQARAAWLNTTRAGLGEGISRFYASRQLDVTAHSVEELIGLESG